MKMNINNLHTSAYYITASWLPHTYHFCICLSLLHLFHEYLSTVKMLTSGQNIERTFALNYLLSPIM